MKKSQSINRRKLIQLGILSVGALTIGSIDSMAQTIIPDSVLQKNNSFAKNGKPQLDYALVQEFVKFSHFNFEAVQKMVSETPELVYASWDWGGGDIETGLGAASHVGNKKIAQFLLEKGARPDIFSATMLGHLDVVKGLITAYPYLKDCKGPHGLSLIHHAQKGGDDAKDVLKYLEKI